MKQSKNFLGPRYSNTTEDNKKVVNLEAYKRKIKGLRKSYWILVFNMRSKKEVDCWSIDTFFEALAALEILYPKEEGGGSTC